MKNGTNSGNGSIYGLTDLTMVIISDVHLVLGVHVKNEIGNLIRFRLLLKSTAAANLKIFVKNNLLSFKLVQ